MKGQGELGQLGQDERARGTSPRDSVRSAAIPCDPTKISRRDRSVSSVAPRAQASPPLGCRTRPPGDRETCRPSLEMCVIGFPSHTVPAWSSGVVPSAPWFSLPFRSVLDVCSGDGSGLSASACVAAPARPPRLCLSRCGAFACVGAGPLDCVAVPVVIWVTLSLESYTPPFRLRPEVHRRSTRTLGVYG